MSGFAWFLVIGVLGALVYWFKRWREKYADRQRASEARFATFMAEARPAAPPVLAPLAQAPADPKERLLLEAATKAGEAGEPVLCIQLYAKLLSRYPQTQFATQARAAVEQQKKKLAKA
jgi:hypothetical protein